MDTPEGRARHDPLAHERRRLIDLTYRFLGSLADAEDVAQETYARWYRMTPDQRNAIESPGAWLTRVASRICLDLLGSARVRRERYVGEWLPEPVPDLHEWTNEGSSRFAIDPADRVTMDDSITMAFLVVLESMTPAERVAFILHEVFRYTFAEIGDIVGRTPEACRQLASSARRRLRTQRTPAASSAEHAEVVSAFRLAWEAKDIDALVRLLDPDVTVITDGGGLVNAELRPVTGHERIARRFIELAAVAPDLTILERTVNGQRGLVTRQGRVTETVLAFDVVNGRVARIWTIRNPEKLRPWQAE